MPPVNQLQRAPPRDALLSAKKLPVTLVLPVLLIAPPSRALLPVKLESATAADPPTLKMPPPHPKVELESKLDRSTDRRAFSRLLIAPPSPAVLPVKVHSLTESVELTKFHSAP